MPHNKKIKEVTPEIDINVSDIKKPEVQLPTSLEGAQLTPEQKEKVMTEYIRLLDRYTEPHNIKSIRITAKDIPLVIADGKDMVAMCKFPRGRYNGAAAIAHSQINDKNPLRFFVLPTGMIIINPFIYNHTKVPVFKEKEGCLSYPDIQEKTLVPRYNKITVTYQTLTQDGKDGKIKLSPFSREDLGGNEAHVFQHECSHLNGCNVYDEDFSPNWSICLGNGILIPPQAWEEGENSK